MTIKRKGSAVWSGGLKYGKGAVSTASHCRGPTVVSGAAGLGVVSAVPRPAVSPSYLV